MRAQTSLRIAPQGENPKKMNLSFGTSLPAHVPQNNYRTSLRNETQSMRRSLSVINANYKPKCFGRSVKKTRNNQDMASCLNKLKI